MKCLKLLQSKHSLILQIDLTTAELHDNLLNSSPGYSFVSDDRNPNFTLKLAEQLLEREQEERRFVQGADVVGVGQRWSSAAFQDWLRLYSELNLLLMLRADLLGGGHSRGREMTAMNFCSTAAQEQRNVMILQQHLLVQHSKSLFLVTIKSPCVCKRSALTRSCVGYTNIL